MDIVTLGAALNGSAEYVNSHFKGGSNIQIVGNPDGTQTINASGEVSAEDTVARAEIAAIKDGETLDSFGDVETALGDKADTSITYTKTEVDTALSAKANSADVYSKTAVDTALGNKADKSTTYTKTEVDTALSAKADKSTTYTKTEVDTALDDKVDKETGKGLSTNDYTTAEKTKLAGIAEGAEVNVQSNWTQTTTTADDYIKNKPTLGTAAAKNATDTYNATGTDVTTGKAVAAALATLPEPMVFKGSLGTGGTITTLPTASSSNKGYVYKVITAGTYASQSAKVGDTFISDGSVWVLIPTGDEPSGTVTNVAVANGGGLTVSGSPITSSGTITVGHSNSVTAKTSSSVKKFTYDAYGHITGSSELSTAESDALASGIDSEKVDQIETNKSNISFAVEKIGNNLVNVPSGSGVRWVDVTVNIPAGVYTFGFSNLSGDDSRQSQVSFYSGGSSFYTYIDKGNDVYINNVTFTNTVTSIRIYASTNSTTSVNQGVNFTTLFLCKQETWNPSVGIQPHAMSNAELTAKEQQNENNILYAQKTGVKNIMDLSKYKELNPSIVVGDNLVFHGITWSISNSSGLTVSGTADSSGSYPTIYSAILPIGTYYLTGGDSTVELLAPNNQREIGQGLTIEITASTTQPYIIRGYVPQSTAITGTHNIKPMLRQVGDTTFEPYAMSNAELTAAIQALQAQLANQ
jgi:hypothetical protein